MWNPQVQARYPPKRVLCPRDCSGHLVICRVLIHHYFHIYWTDIIHNSVFLPQDTLLQEARHQRQQISSDRTSTPRPPCPCDLWKQSSPSSISTGIHVLHFYNFRVITTWKKTQFLYCRGLNNSTSCSLLNSYVLNNRLLQVTSHIYIALVLPLNITFIIINHDH